MHIIKKIFKGTKAIVRIPFHVLAKMRLQADQTSYSKIPHHQKRDIYRMYLQEAGVLNYSSLRLSPKNELIGNINESADEMQFIKNILAKKLLKKRQIVAFDAGANLGYFSYMLFQSFDDIIVHAFEPGEIYNKLIETTKDYNIIANNKGLYKEEKKLKYYVYDGDKNNDHGSILKNVDAVYGVDDEAKSHEISVTTVDNYCKANNITHIDFLKIDVEGADYDVLLGAEEMLKKDAISIIMVEFNEMNLIARIFLRDYYNLLLNYNFYRIAKGGGLYSLGEYQVLHEVFAFQNLVMIRKEEDV